MLKILAAVDKSRYASTVMDTVAKIASFTECNILILTVIDSKRPRRVQLTKEDEESIREFHKDLIRRHFPQKEIEIQSRSNPESNRLIPVQGVTVHTKTVEGDPTNSICDWAEEVNADLVVVGKKGAGEASASILGSVSESVVHKCRRSVLVAIRERSDHANWSVGQADVQDRTSSIS